MSKTVLSLLWDMRVNLAMIEEDTVLRGTRELPQAQLHFLLWWVDSTRRYPDAAVIAAGSRLADSLEEFREYTATGLSWKILPP